tara:strand:- start:1608 stop:2540 length:933 start_codon:yes stop_codon:yes gene_type:complete
MVKKIIFMGTPYFAVPILETLHQHLYQISAVYTQSPKKSKRGQKINKSPIQNISEKLNLNLRTPNTLKGNKTEFDYIKKIKADLAIVVAYGQIIPKNFLNLTKKGFINIHASILPKWRGAAPIQRSIMNSDKETGISIMKIDEKLDSGPVSNIYKISLNENDNSDKISEKLSSLAAKKIIENIEDILSDKAKFMQQDHSKATYAKKIRKTEGEINWNEEAGNIIAKINGLFPSPSAFFKFKGERYKVLKAQIGNRVGKNGEIVSHPLEVACANDKSVKILEIQREGKKIQKIEEFMLGTKIKKGSILSNV